jgi:hypothetical protein
MNDAAEIIEMLSERVGELEVQLAQCRREEGDGCRSQG